MRALLLIAVGLVALVWLIPAAPLTGDGQHYIAFVRNNLQHGASSWHERRILGPFIVRALPLDAQTGFLVLTVVSLSVTGVLTWLAARELIQDELHALLAIPFLFGTWVVAPNLREYALVDPLAWAFVAGIWLATLRRAWLWTALLAAVGVMAKEIVLLVAVAAAVSAWTPQRPWRAILIACPAALMVVGLTLVFPGSGTDARAYLFSWVRDGLFSNGVGRAIFLVFASYAALWLLALAGWRVANSLVRRAIAVFALGALALPLVGSPERMEEAIFPGVITLALLATRRLPLGVVWVLALGNALFLARVGGDAPLPTVVAWSGLVVACAIALSLYLPLARLVPTRWSLAKRT
ncbi:MAG: hypothetical protein NVSMB2_05930 [Chloroflexota bacterium]